MAERKLGSIKSYSYIEEESKLPDVVKFSSRSIVLPDIFLVALGFEKRSIEMSKVLSTIFEKEDCRHTKAIVAEYRTNSGDNENNRKPLAESLNRFCEETLRIDADDPGSLFADLSREINVCYDRKKTKIRVVFDISGASGNFILSAFKVFIALAPKVHLIVLYAEAGQYFPPHEMDVASYESNLSKACQLGDASSYSEFGVRNPERNELYPGFFHDSRPDYVIAIPSFRANRILRCLQSIGDQILAAPQENIYWIFGVPPAPSNAWREQFQKDMVLQLLRSVSGSEGLHFNVSLDTTRNAASCSTLKYQEIAGKLISVADAKLGCRLSLIHMGSKMQSVGLALALAVRSEIAVTFARPDSFNPSLYSEQIGDCWQITFDNLEGVINALTKTGTIKYIPATGQIGKERPSL
jgi:hypothetical protein